MLCNKKTLLCTVSNTLGNFPIHNLKCFVNWTVTELRVQAILGRIYYFAIFDDKL